MVQNNTVTELIIIPNSNICPVTALVNIFALTPKGGNVPIFQFKLAGTWLSLTDNRVRHYFTLILSKLLSVIVKLCKTSRNIAPGHRTVCG